MGETRRVADQLKRAVRGVAWHGPSLLELLRDVPLEHVGLRPVAGAHTIAEITRHALAWQDIVTRRLAGEVWRDETPDEDWPVTSGAAEWQSLLERLESGALKLAADIEAFPDERLREIVPGAEHSFYGMLHGLVQHHLYHAGQIAILKRALQSARR